MNIYFYDSNDKMNKARRVFFNLTRMTERKAKTRLKKKTLQYFNKF